MNAIEALYLHIPFCHTICPFCPFAVHGNRARLHRPYLEALFSEIDRQARKFGPATGAIRSLYIGGGTPSTLAPGELAEVLERLQSGFSFGSGAEGAIEINPEDCTPSYLSELQKLGLNRFSVGLQSLDAATLRALGRSHSAAQGRRALEALRSVNTKNFNLDLMFGAPGVELAAFRKDIERVLEIRPPHLSLYGLDIEPGTRFGRDPAIQKAVSRQGDAPAESYLWASAALTAAGYRHYEVSNFALPGAEGLQNRIVWDGGNYLGFGTGAHSHVDGERWHNHRHMRAYNAALRGGDSPVAYREKLSRAQLANEALLLGLRRDTGIDIAAWEARYGFSWNDGKREFANRLVRTGKARLSDGRFSLTRSGFLLADGVTEQLMVAE